MYCYEKCFITEIFIIVYNLLRHEVTFKSIYATRKYLIEQFQEGEYTFAPQASSAKKNYKNSLTQPVILLCFICYCSYFIFEISQEDSGLELLFNLVHAFSFISNTFISTSTSLKLAYSEK